MELLLESQIHHKASLTELAVCGEKVSSLTEEAAAATLQGSTSPIPKQAVVQRTQVPFGSGTSQCTFWGVAAGGGSAAC